MPRDLPDWGALSAQATVYEITDLGELAVRLGSIVSYDRSGDVIWLDDFEDGITKWSYIILAGASCVVDTTTCRSGTKSVRMVGEALYGGVVILYRLFPFPILSSFGAEISFFISSDLRSHELTLNLYDGTKHVQYGIRWDGVNKRLLYYDGDPDYKVFATGVNLSVDSWLFHTWKMVVDGVNRRYRYLLLDDQVYDLSDYIPLIETDPRLGYGEFSTSMQAIVGTEGIVYVDDPILTQNQP